MRQPRAQLLDPLRIPIVRHVAGLRLIMVDCPDPALQAWAPLDQKSLCLLIVM